ncbi:MAG: TIGR00159 family protein, partial [Dolichospermum sp.]
MRDWWKQWLINLGDWSQSLLLGTLDMMLVLALTYIILAIISERRTLWMVRGFIILMLCSVLSSKLGLPLLSFVLEKLVIGCAVA